MSTLTNEQINIPTRTLPLKSMHEHQQCTRVIYTWKYTFVNEALCTFKLTAVRQVDPGSLPFYMQIKLGALSKCLHN